MALVPAQPRNIPIARSPVAYFPPRWQLGQWNSFMTPQQMMPMVPPPPMMTMEQARQEMNRQMQQMQENMARAMANFQRLFPMVPTMPPVSHNDMKDSYVTEPDGNQRFRLTFDVRTFKPEELEIRTDDNMLSVYAAHQEQGPNGAFKREYRRTFLVPPNVRPESLQSVLSPEGVLTVEGPVQGALPAPPSSTSRALPVAPSTVRPVNPVQSN